MKLFYAPASPFVRMVLVTAHELGLEDDIELVPTGPLTPVEAHTALTAANPAGKIPALETDHGTVLYDSRVICEYLCHHAGDDELRPEEPVARFRTLTLEALGQAIAEAGISARYEMAVRPEDLHWQAWTDRQMSRIDACLNDLETGWHEELDTLSSGSIAVACALSYLDFRFEELDWRASRASLADFYEAFSTRISMQETTPA